MRDQNPHLSDRDLLLAADGELPKYEAARVNAHLAYCWTCRARMREVDNAIVDFIHVRDQLMPALPPADGSRALLRLRLARLAESSEPPIWAQIGTILRSRAVGLAWSAGLGLLICAIVWRYVEPAPDPHPRVAEFKIKSVPDPHLTPGATLPLTRDRANGNPLPASTSAAYCWPRSPAHRAGAGRRLQRATRGRSDPAAHPANGLRSGRQDVPWPGAAYRVESSP